MRRTLYILAILAVLAGCSDPEPELKEANSATNTLVQPKTPPANTASTTEPAPAPVLFDVMSIASKSEADVGAALGQPIETEVGEWTLLPSEEKTPMTRNVYAQEAGEVEVLFIEGKAARISFEPKDDLRYPDDAIKAMELVGLAAGDRNAPDFEAPHYVRYEGVNDFFFVDVISGRPENPDRIREVKVVTDEKYK